MSGEVGARCLKMGGVSLSDEESLGWYRNSALSRVGVNYHWSLQEAVHSNIPLPW